MKKIFIVAALAVAINACNNRNTTDKTGADSTAVTATKDSTGNSTAKSDLKSISARLVKLVNNHDELQPYIDFDNLKIHVSSVGERKEDKLQFFAKTEGKGHVEITHVLQDGNKIAVHFGSEINGVKTVNWYVFNYNEAGKLNELWTNTQALMPPNASGRTMLDGTTGILDLDRTEVNRVIMRSFFDNVIIGIIIGFLIIILRATAL